MGRSLDQIVELLVREIRVAGLALDASSPLPPNDASAEREIIAGLLSGTVRPRELEPLEAGDFFWPLHVTVYAAAIALDARDRPVGLDPIVELLERAEAGPNTRELLEALRDLTPFALRRRLVELAPVVRELSERRRLIRRLERLTVRLRFESSNTSEALEELAAITTNPERICP